MWGKINGANDGCTSPAPHHKSAVKGSATTWLLASYHRHRRATRTARSTRKASAIPAIARVGRGSSLRWRHAIPIARTTPAGCAGTATAHTSSAAAQSKDGRQGGVGPRSATTSAFQRHSMMPCGSLRETRAGCVGSRSGRHSLTGHTSTTATQPTRCAGCCACGATSDLGKSKPTLMPRGLISPAATAFSGATA